LLGSEARSEVIFKFTNDVTQIDVVSLYGAMNLRPGPEPGCGVPALQTASKKYESLTRQHPLSGLALFLRDYWQYEA
jgi:hypothetical protein